jgi:hypothetical protein
VSGDEDMSVIGRALASGFGRDFNASNARLVRADDSLVDDECVSLALALMRRLELTVHATIGHSTWALGGPVRRADDMVGQDDEMDDLVNELAALEVDPLKRSAANRVFLRCDALCLDQRPAITVAC